MDEGISTSEDCLSEEDAAKYLGVTLAKLRQFWLDERIDTYYVKTGQPVRRLGLPWEDHPDNKLCYHLDDLNQLKESLKAEESGTDS